MGAKDKGDQEKEKEEKRGRNIFRTRVWINKERKTRVGGEKKEMEKKKRDERKRRWTKKKRSRKKKEIKKKKGIETKMAKHGEKDGKIIDGEKTKEMEKKMEKNEVDT